MASEFHATRRVEFRDTDAAGIVHFSVFFTWMEQAEHELLRHVGLSVFATDAGGTLTWPRVSASCNYQGSLRFEDAVHVDVRIARLGTKSVTYAFDFKGPGAAGAGTAAAGATVASGELTAVCCRLESGGRLTSIAIPDDIRARLAPFVSLARQETAG